MSLTSNFIMLQLLVFIWSWLRLLDSALVKGLGTVNLFPQSTCVFVFEYVHSHLL